MIVLVLLPALILVLVTAMEMTDGEYGGPAILGALAAALLGPAAYVIATKQGTGVRR